MTEPIELARYRRVTIGTDGDIRVDAGAKPKHAEIVAKRDGAGSTVALLRPLDGKVDVRRHGDTTTVASAWRLADGDVILIGPHRITYNDLSNPAPIAGLPEEEEEESWLHS